MRIVHILYISLLMLCSCHKEPNAQNDIKEITHIIAQQQKDWNNNDLKGFMEAYHQTDSLFFYSGAQLKTGWTSTLDSYKKNYPDASHTGELTFTIAKIHPINQDSYFVMGEYMLKRTVGDAKGTFMIIFKRIDGKWKIIADSSC
ncbi:YybH family protein [Maribacter sp. MAR_2009_72]|uniref:YybH family protein n=1 Tax=Maribacter sp. MAR_2009_72 TaxID=1250050 RepID=UPI0011A72050|nr:nuclear transport factor 2 family protein [Maribacter sp. MAR_2009_72]